MDRTTFETIAAEEFSTVPQRFKQLIKNVALLIEDEPSQEIRTEENLEEGETLLGLYQGIPNTARGEGYGMGNLPDTITLYYLPLTAEAENLQEEGRAQDLAEAMRLAIRETLWHEIGHYFGLDDDAIHGREDAGTNTFT